MSVAQLDVTPFVVKSGRRPEVRRQGLWTFEIDGDEVSFWGTLAEAFSTAKLYAMVEDIPDAHVNLVDCQPLPRVRMVGHGPEGSGR